MKGKTLLTFLAGAALSLAAAGCNNADNTNANSNANGNANHSANTNANANNANTNAHANANNSNSRNYNISREEYNKNENSYRAEAKNTGESIGTGLEDGWIHFKVRGALATADDLRDSTINVDVDNKVVTLRGSVASAEQKAKAEKAAHVEGATKVVNKLEVRANGSGGGNHNGGGANANANAHGASNSNKKG